LILCCMSCRDRYHDWTDFYRQLESRPSHQPIPAISHQTDDIAHHLQRVLWHLDSGHKLGNISSLPKNIAVFYQAKQTFEAELYDEAIDLLLPHVQQTPTTTDEVFLLLEATLLLIDVYYYNDDYVQMKRYLSKLGGQIDVLPQILRHYFTTRLLRFETSIHINHGDGNKALATYHYAQYVAHHFLPDFTMLPAKIDFNENGIFIQAGDQYFSRASQSLLRLSRIFKSDKQRLTRIYAHWITISTYRGNHQEADSIVQLALRDTVGLSAKSRNYLMINILAHYNITGTPAHVLRADSLVQKLEMRSKRSCSKNDYVFALYRAESMQNKGLLGQAQLILDSISLPSHCNPRVKKLIQFYVGRSRLNLWEADKTSSHIIRSLDQRIQNRALALDLFQGEDELHLDDYYAIELRELLSLMKQLQQQDQVPDRYLESILRILDDTKSREWRRDYSLDLENATFGDESPLAQYNHRIREGLRLANDFLHADTTYAAFYKDLYHAYRSKDSLLQTVQFKPTISKPFSLSTIQSQLMADEAELVYFFAFRGDIYTIRYDGHHMNIRHLSAHQAKPIVSQYLDRIMRQQSETTTDLLRNQLLGAASSRKAYIVTSGIFNHFPMDRWFDDYQVIPTLDFLMRREPIYIDKTKVAIFAFSDPTTRKSTQKQIIGELYHDYEEGQDISKILKLKPQFYAGRNTHIDAFARAMRSDAVHISTHSVADTANRLNSHLFLRHPRTGMPQALYISQLYTYPRAPIFVNLASCSSGIGTTISGVGEFALSRPFFSLGSQAVLKTLWKIDDQANRTFMQAFYTFWASGKSLAESISLAKASLQRSDRYHHPYYWSAYILEGRGDIYIMRQK
jgi:CHAT domain